MSKRVEFERNPNDPQWEVKYWAGALDVHGSIYMDSYVPGLDAKGSNTPGLAYFDSRVHLPSIHGLDYPAILSRQFGSSAQLSSWAWEVSAKKALLFLEPIETYLIIRRLQAQLAIEFQKDRAVVHRLPSSERTAYRLSIGETYYPEMTYLNNVGIYDQFRFDVPDQLDPAYVTGVLEFGLRPRMDPRKESRVKGLDLEWRSSEAAERIQAYFGGSVVNIVGGGFRNTWGIEDSRELLDKVQPYFKLRYMIDLEEPFRFNPVFRRLFTNYHRLVVNLAAALISPHPYHQHPDQQLNLIDQTAKIGFICGHVAGMKQCLDELGLVAYTEKSQEQASKLLLAQ